MKHAMIEKSTPEQVEAAKKAADWLIDAIATATQDRRFLRGEPEYDRLIGDAVFANGVVACLRAIHNVDVLTS